MFIEANVKKWGLAPMTGSLAPPPPYGSEHGSVLLEIGGGAGQASDAQPNTSNAYVSRHHTHGRTRSGNFLRPGAVRSPTDISLAHLPSHDESREGEGQGAGGHAHLGQPPDYSSPPGSIRTRSPPIPSYSQAVSGAGSRETDRLLPQSDGSGERSRSGTV